MARRRILHIVVCNVAPVLACMWVLSACAGTQEIIVRSDRSGETMISIDLVPDVVERIEEMAALTGIELAEDGLINLDSLRKTLNTLPGVTVTRVENTEEHSFSITFTFADALTIFPSPNPLWEAGIVSLENLEEGTQMRIYLDLDNYEQLSEVFPALEDPVIRAIGPEENTQITADDYLTMMEFILGPSGPEAISESVVTIKVTVEEGELVSQSGGRIEDGVALFNLRLLDLLLLHEPIDLQISFR